MTVLRRPNISENKAALYQFTHDNSLLRRYFSLRKDIYIKDFNLHNFSDHEDNYDNHENTDILVVTKGNAVIGGSRLIISPQYSDHLLPLESNNFRLKNMFPDLKLHSLSYCEANRTVVHSDYRDGQILKEMICQLVLRAQAYGIRYFFTIGPAIQIRNNKRHCDSLGIHFEIMSDITVPDKPAYRGRKMYFAITDLHLVKLDGHKVCFQHMI